MTDVTAVLYLLVAVNSSIMASHSGLWICMSHIHKVFGFWIFRGICIFFLSFSDSSPGPSGAFNFFFLCYSCYVVQLRKMPVSSVLIITVVTQPNIFFTAVG